jgi:hypothetical protein
VSELRSTAAAMSAASWTSQAIRGVLHEEVEKGEVAPSRRREILGAAAAAAAVAEEARKWVASYVADARGAGVSWAELGAELAGRRDCGCDATASDAFALVVGSPVDGPGGRVFTWTCETCHEAIRDFGPGVDFSQREEGHRSDCERRAVEMESYLRSVAVGRAW